VIIIINHIQGKGSGDHQAQRRKEERILARKKRKEDLSCIGAHLCQRYGSLTKFGTDGP
jgi:hypothetical protein